MPPASAFRLLLALAIAGSAVPPASAAPSRKTPRGVYLRYDPGPAALPPRQTTVAPGAPARLALTGLAGLTGLPATVDAPGQCRARCARERYACEAGGEDCAPAWAACLRPCGATPAR